MPPETSDQPDRPAARPSFKGDLGAFTVRVMVVVAVIGAGVLAWRMRDAIAIGFGSVLLAVGWLGLAAIIHRRTGCPPRLAVGLVIVASVAVIAGVVWVFQAAIADQYAELVRQVPVSIHAMLEKLSAYPLGRTLLAEIGAISHNGASEAAASAVSSGLGQISRSFTYALIMLFGGVFLALDPERYRKGLLKLAPPSRREAVSSLMRHLTVALQRWLASRLVVMAAVGVLASIGMWALQIPAPFALGLTGAILTFIPFIGALLAMAPAMVIGFARDPMMVVWVALLFWAVHFIEGTFITPYVQDKAVDIPPVLSIFSTLVFTLLLGPIGVVLAAPLTVVVIVLVDALNYEEAPSAQP